MMSTNVDRWLWERKLFNQLILLPFFSNFRSAMGWQRGVCVSHCVCVPVCVCVCVQAYVYV